MDLILMVLQAFDLLSQIKALVGGMIIIALVFAFVHRR